MITAATLPLAAITTITNADNLFVSVLLGSLVGETLDGLVTFCVPAVEEIVVVCVVAGECFMTIVVESIELVGEFVILCTKEETDV